VVVKKAIVEIQEAVAKTLEAPDIEAIMTVIPKAEQIITHDHIRIIQAENQSQEVPFTLITICASISLILCAVCIYCCIQQTEKRIGDVPVAPTDMVTP
jgi:hypothetical protein